MKRSFMSILLGIGWVGIAMAGPPKVKQIVFERGFGFSPTPGYRVTLDSDGSVLYRGLGSVPSVGGYKGTISTFEFTRLSSLIDRLGFATFKSRYESPVTDQGTQVLTVTTDKGRKTVSEDGSSGPDELWAIQTLIDQVTAEIRSKGADVKVNPPGEIDITVRSSGKKRGH